MSATVKTGWLKDSNGEKFAPKTLVSQVQTSDGIMLEEKIQNDVNIAIDTAKSYTDSVISHNVTNEIDPTVPAWAKASNKPSYTASEVGAYTKAEIDTLELITVSDIDAICGATIQVANKEGVAF